MNRCRKQGSSTQPYQKYPVLYKPFIVGYMSIDVTRSYSSDLSQLKFVNDIPKGRISWDLDHNIDQAVKRTTVDTNEKTELLLKFLLDQRSRFHFPPSTFISYRRTLISIMESFNNTPWKPIIITATLFKSNIYLFIIDKSKEEESPTDLVKKYSDWGYKFHQYMISDKPNLSPNIDRPVVENEDFTLCYCSEIGGHKLFYGVQTDGLLATSDTAPPPETTNVKENIAYLRRHQYVELKTNKEFVVPKLEFNFRRYKLFTCWCKCYFGNAKGLVVGFRTDDGIVRRLQWFDTADIPKYCKNEWNPGPALSFLDRFLSYVKKSMNSYYEGNNNDDNPRTLEFEILDRQISVIENPEPITILPNWYMEALTQHKE